MNSICYIVGASDSRGMCIDKREGDFIIAADGGLDALEKLSIAPDLAVGDFDSLGYIPDIENKICHPVEKDDTDTALAVSEGLRRGYRRFVIYGGLGGRLDHTLANLQSCTGAAKNGAVCALWGDGCAVCVIPAGYSLLFDEKKRGTVSVFSPDKTEGVTVEGLKYTVSGVTLTSDFPLGVSNEFMGKEASIYAGDGVLVVMWNEDARSFVETVR